MGRKKLRYDNQTRACLESLGLATPRGGLRFDGEHADAGESLFILQELQAIEQRIYETPFGQLKSNELIPIVADIPAGASEWGYDRVTGYGLAQWVAADARDIPRADVKRERVTFPLRDMGVAYEYTRRDLLAAAMAGMPLDAMKAQSARRAIDSFRDKVFLEGDSSVGMSGFMNDSTVTVQNVAHGAWDGSAATADQVIAEVNSAIATIGAVTKENYWPDTLAVPMPCYAWLTTTARSSNSDTTIWEYVLRNQPYVKTLVPVLQLGNASDPGGKAPGVGGVGRAVLYKRDPEVLKGPVSLMFEQLPPQAIGFSMQIPCRASIGGVHWRVPIAALYIDGVRAA